MAEVGKTYDYYEQRKTFFRFFQGTQEQEFEVRRETITQEIMLTADNFDLECRSRAEEIIEQIENEQVRFLL